MSWFSPVSDFIGNVNAALAVPEKKTAHIQFANKGVGPIYRFAVLHVRGLVTPNAGEWHTWYNIGSQSTGDKWQIEFETGLSMQSDTWFFEVQVEQNGPVFTTVPIMFNLNDGDRHENGCVTVSHGSNSVSIEARSGSKKDIFFDKSTHPDYSAFAWVQVENRMSKPIKNVKLERIYNDKTHAMTWPEPIQPQQKTDPRVLYFYCTSLPDFKSNYWNISIEKDGEGRVRRNKNDNRRWGFSIGSHGGLAKVIVTEDWWNFVDPTGAHDVADGWK